MFWLFKSICARFLGFIFFNYYLGVYRPYYGRQKVYTLLQDDANQSFIKKALLAYVIDDFAMYRDRIRADYDFYGKHKNKSRVSRRVVGDSLKSYGKAVYEDGGETFEDQQRGQVLQLLEPVLKDTQTPLHVAEIGCDNGDVIAHLAKTYDQHSYSGIDFSTESANTLHGEVRNLNFHEGYAMDFLENGDVKPNVIWGSSTFMFFTPPELKSYLTLLKGIGCQHIFINEPTWAGYKPSENGGTFSKHMEDVVWFHNYYGYFKDAGYEVAELKAYDYKHPNSQREDILQMIYHATPVS